MDVKSASLQVKAAGPDDGLEDGQFIGYASVFGNVDSYGDIVEKGAFASTLAEWSEKGTPIPVLWGHDMSSPMSNIGSVIKAEEDDNGLKIHAALDLDTEFERKVYKLLKDRRVDRMSFAYTVRDSDSQKDGNHLKDLQLHEVSIVPIPANERAEVMAVKQAAESLAKAGRILSSKNESALRDARDAIDSVLSALSDDEGEKSTSHGGNDDQEKASDAGRIKDEDAGTAGDGHPVVKSEGAARSSSVSTLAAKAHIYALKGAERGSR